MSNKYLVLSAIAFAGISSAVFAGQARAESLLVACTAETQSANGAVITDQAFCTVPSNKVITRAVLQSTLDDGGEITVNSSQVFTANPNIIGIKNNTTDLSANLFSSGQGFFLEVVARNAVDSSGNFVGPVYGKAVVSVYGNDAASPTADIKANGSDGPVSVSYGTSATISWTSQNANSCSVSPSGWTGTSGSQSTGSLTSGRTFSLTCTGQNGTTASDSVTVNVGTAPAVSADIKANGSDGPVNIPFNTPATISWTSQNANSCSIFPGGWNGTSGSQSTGNLTWSQTYIVNCTGTAGSASDSVTVNIGSAPAVSADIKANGSDGPVSVSYGTSATISWTSQNANSCSVFPGGWTGTSGSQSTGNLIFGNMYTVTCTGQNGATASDSVTVNVGTAPTVTADIKANDQNGSATIGYNTSATVTWTSQNANSCSVSPSGWTGTSGSQSTGNLTASRTYSLTCTGSTGSATDSVTVNIGSAPAVSADIKANGSDGPVSVAYNASATVTWTSQNANSCVVYPAGWTGTSGSQSTGNLTGSQTYTMSCTGAGGTTSDSVMVNAQPATAPSVTLAANPSYVNQNQPSILTWTSQNANSCVASGGWSGSKNLNGSETVTPSYGATYNIICYGASGQSAQAQATIQVQAVSNYPVLTLSSNPSVINQGQHSTLTWSSNNAISCNATSYGWNGSKSLSGSEQVSPGQSTTYSMTCTGQNGQQVNAQTSVYVHGNTYYNLPTVNLVANPGSVSRGQSTTLSWSSQNASYCYASGGWSGGKSGYGYETVSPTFNTTYTITCTNQSGTANDSETIFVTDNYYGGTALSLQVTKTVLNRSLNQNYYSNSIQAQGLDVLEFEIRVRNTDSYGGSVNVQDVLPQELFYVPNSTNVDGASVADGIIGGGISLGYMNPGEGKTIRFRSTVFVGTAQKTITNQANANMNGRVQTAYATINIRSRGQVLGAADIITGPDDPLLWVLFLGFLGSLGFYLVAFRYHWIRLGTPVMTPFERLIAEIREREKYPDTAGRPSP